jgi:hypothetical protein
LRERKRAERKFLEERRARGGVEVVIVAGCCSSKLKGEKELSGIRSEERGEATPSQYVYDYLCCCYTS